MGQMGELLAWRVICTPTLNGSVLDDFILSWMEDGEVMDRSWKHRLESGSYAKTRGAVYSDTRRNP